MNWDEGTGGRVSFEGKAPAQLALPYGSVSGDPLTPGIETPGSQCTGEGNGRSARAPVSRPPSSRRIPERALRKRRLCLKACLDELERIRNGSDDPILKGNSLADARNHLQALWERVEGNPDSEAFEEMINVLQVALCVENPQSLATAQLNAICSVLVKMHDDPDLDDQEANDLTQELIKGGVDVFREIG